MNAAYLILAAPLAGALLLLFGGRRIGQPISGVIVTALGFASFAATVVTWLTLLGKPAGGRTVTKGIFTWIPVGRLHVSFGLQIDPLSIFMSLFVTGVSSLIFLYSIGYMRGDPDNPRFFFYLSLFLFSMVILVLSDNFLFTFLGWEGVGFCSYGLIGFWFERNRAAVAAKKAFVTNRVGDFGFMIALFLMYEHFGSFSYSVVLHHLSLSNGFATALALMLLLGACGKSAQIPLYMWLPDAMEGPTPISALIHAATMVTAGVYLLARSAPIIHFSPFAQILIACLGIATAFVASTIACAENDIKRILAYSTLAEIGFMFLAEGSGDYSSALFLTITHAFFKALLFLAAGAVIHAMSDEQNIKRMGGLARYIPITFATFMIGYLALAAIPPFAGWWAHESVLEAAWHKNFFLWLTGVVVDGLTAYYMSRLVVLVFTGQARWRENRPEPVAHASGAQGGQSLGERPHDSHDATPHDAPWTMTIPLIILGFCSFFGGVLNLPFGSFDFIDRFLHPVFPTSVVPVLHLAVSTRVTIGVIGTAVNFVGLFAGLGLWRRYVERPALEPSFLAHGWYLDESIAATVNGPVRAGAGGLAYGVDRRLIDGMVNGLAGISGRTGRAVRRLQTGYVRTYALGIALGAALILCYVAIR